MVCYTQRVPKICETCGKQFISPLSQYPSRANRGRFCSRRCVYSFQRGANHPYWRGGLLNNGKYLVQYAPEHPQAQSKGYVPQHRLVVEAAIGRYLEPGEDVHHRNGNKTDNRIENLVVLTHGEHSSLHNSLRT